MIVIDTEQGGEEWKKYKIGVPSASKFGAVLAKGQGATRKKYLIDKVAERLTGKFPEQYVSDDMLRGVELEPDARDAYAFTQGVEVIQAGLALLDDKSACASPDGLVGVNGGLEIKSVKANTHIETILSGKMPPKHKPQVQGNLWIWEREWWDFMSYCPDIADRPIFIQRVYRDEDYIKNLMSEINRFNDDVNEVVNKIKTI